MVPMMMRTKRPPKPLPRPIPSGLFFCCVAAAEIADVLDESAACERDERQAKIDSNVPIPSVGSALK